MRSTYRSSVIRVSTASRSGTSMKPSASGGSPAFSRPLARIAAITPFDSRASRPPRSTHAFPLLTQRAAASAVTLGRLS
jgi:hypothetical protein